MEKGHQSKQEDDGVSRMKFGHTWLISTLLLMINYADGSFDYCRNQKKIEHVIVHCPKYHQDRQRLLTELEVNKIGLN